MTGILSRARASRCTRRDPSRRGRHPSGVRPTCLPSGCQSVPAARQPEAGYATAEFAVAMPAALLLLLGAVACVMAVTVKLQCVAAAREAALAAARGDGGVAAGTAAAPPGADVRVSASGDTVRATVRVTLHPFGARLPGVDVGADAVAVREPGTGGTAAAAATTGTAATPWIRPGEP